MKTTSPSRLQFRRTKGFNLQRVSRAANALPAKLVCRPSKYGNPHTMRNESERGNCVRLYAAEMELWSDERKQQAVKDLAGHNLACYCEPGLACHADTLLRAMARWEREFK